MKIENMLSPTGNPVPNQFILTEEGKGRNPDEFIMKQTFQSYNAIICIRTTYRHSTETLLDQKYWDYSPMTGKYRNIFLGETKRITYKKLRNGVYTLTKLQ